MRMSESSKDSFDRLLEIKKDQEDLIATDISVFGSFGMVRSASQGDTIRAQATNV